MVSHNDAECDKNKMAAMECKTNNDGIVINKQVRKQIVGNIKDASNTGRNSWWNKTQKDRKKSKPLSCMVNYVSGTDQKQKKLK